MRMHEEPQVSDDISVWLPQALHDLCQPLTALECGLFIGTMSPDGIRSPRAEELLATILEALAQCERITTSVRTIQARIADQNSN